MNIATYSMNIATYNACKLNILSCSHKITMSEDYKCEGLTLMGESYSSPSINMWSWVCVITSLDLCFLIYKMRIIIIIILQVSHEYCIYRHICICIYVFICIYLHVYLYVCVCVCVCVCVYIHIQEKEMATHSSILAWRIPGTEEPGGLPSMESQRLGHD